MPLKFALTMPLLLAAFVANAQTAETVIVNPAHPLSVKDTALRRAVVEWSRNPTAGAKAHPSAQYFPGSVKAGEKVIVKTVQIKHTQAPAAQIPIINRLVFSGIGQPTMYSTGLYAIAGKEITIRIPDSLVARNMRVRIGCHTDELQNFWSNDEDWRRMPIVTKEVAIKQKETKVASPFGGLVYIEVPYTEASFDAGIVISGAIQAPYFQLGKNSKEDWLAMVRDNKAPWGELASPNLTVSIPDSVLQQIKDPIAVMTLWEKIIQGEMELAQLPQPFYRSQRLVPDEHMSLGAMHSGYPIMIHHSPSKGMISNDVIVDPQKLLTPSRGGANWGFFHELGHNMQNYDLVFDGTTEVSCNFFSLYMFDRLMGGRDGAHDGVSNESTMKLMNNYFAAGAIYEDWKQEPFLGLIMFRQLQEAFGWETFKTFFRIYHNIVPEQGEVRVLTEEEKRDEFMINFSKAAGRNLAPFFKTWGIPISSYATAKVQDLKVWMPYNFPPVK